MKNKKTLVEINGDDVQIATALLIYEFAYKKTSYMRNKNACLCMTGLIMDDSLIRNRYISIEEDPNKFSIEAYNELNMNNFEYDYDNRIQIDSEEIIRRISTEKSFYYFSGFFFEIRYDENGEQRMALVATESVDTTVTIDSFDGSRLYSSSSGKRFLCFIQSAKYNRDRFGYDLILHDGTPVFVGQHGLPRWDGEELLDSKFWRKGLNER